MSQEATANFSAIALFIKLCDCPEIEKTCKVYQEFWQGTIALFIDCQSQKVVSSLWKQKQLLDEAAIRLGIGKKIVIMLNGRVCGPPWNPTLPGQTTIMIYPSQISGTQQNGDVAKRILDSGLSAGIVDIETNVLLLGSQQIASTSGRDSFYMLTSGKDLNSLWEPQVLDELNRDLRQRGKIDNPEYEAYTWVEENGLWKRAKKLFHAVSFEALPFLDRWCRVSYGVEIIS
ncbi:hypothetical protein NDA01_21740 [Trichocoleus desertorum AS-A10]|uniref:hypothetical protein n=1 Tax=Trichocoleus desertorum TaxID=1481672 RepID=UPI0032967F76